MKQITDHIVLNTEWLHKIQIENSEPTYLQSSLVLIIALAMVTISILLIFLVRYRYKQIISNQKQIIDNITKDLNKYSKAIIHSPSTVVITDRNGNIEYVNPKFTQLTGYTYEEAKGKNPRILKSGRQPVEYYKKLWNTILAGNEWRGEFLNRKKNGELYWEYASISPIMNENGEVQYFVAVKENITRRKQTEEKLQTSEANLQSLINNTNDCIWSIDKNYKIITVNNSFIELFHSVFRVKIHKGVNLIDLSPDEYTKQWKILYQEAFEGKRQIVEQKYEINGEINYFEVAINPVYSDENNITGASVFSRNITERKNSEEKIRYQRNLLETTIEALTHPFYVIDAETLEVTLANSAARNEKFEDGIFCFKLTHNLERPCYREGIPCPVLEVKKHKAQVTVIHKHKNKRGEIRSYEIHAYPILDSNGEVDKIIEYSLDITDRKKAEDALKQSEKKLKELNATKDKFFSIIAHDLKNPFNVLIGSSEMLLKNYDKFNTTHYKQVVRNINQSAKYGYSLLENLLKWARSQTNRIQWKPITINLKDLTHDVILIFEQTAETKNIKLTYSFDDNLTIYADYDMISTVLRNLISNALKFTPKGGEIQILANPAYKNNMIEITVSDTGIGIDKQHLNKLFRIDVTHSTSGINNEKGTGLGLILCKEFVEKNNGKIRVESEIGKGSRFIFTLPKSSNVTTPQRKTKKARENTNEVKSLWYETIRKIKDENQNTDAIKKVMMANILPKYHDALKTQSFSAIRTFALDVSTFGKNYKLPVFVSFAEKLIHYIDTFEVEKIIIALNEFSEFEIDIKLNIF